MEPSEDSVDLSCEIFTLTVARSVPGACGTENTLSKFTSLDPVEENGFGPSLGYKFMKPKESNKLACYRKETDGSFFGDKHVTIKTKRAKSSQ